MKIIHVIFSMQIGGSETMLVDILNEQIKEQNSVELIIINKNYNADLISRIDDRIKITYLNRVKGLTSVWTAILFNIYLLRSKPTVLHFHDHTGVNFLVFKQFKKVLTLHALGFESLNWKKYDDLCAISKSVQKDIFDRSRLSAHLVYNGIYFDKVKTQGQLPKSDIFKIVQVGRLDHNIKAQDVLIQAISLMRERGLFNISVDFIGEGESHLFLQDLVNKHGLQAYVSFLGVKSRDYIYEHLCEYDLLVQPSNDEGFGLTVAEGIAAKIPVLISNNDGPMEVINNGEFGFFFEKGNAESCAQQIQEIINSYEIDDLVNRAYEYAYANFNIQTTARNYLKLYEQ